MTAATLYTFDVSRIHKAAERIRGEAALTPLVESVTINQLVGGRVLVKAECFQRTGSFKFRGAYNKILGLPHAAQQRGVIAYSSGNHAQGVAAAAALCGTKATILMPSDAPRIKIARTRSFGANVIPYDRENDDRHEMMQRIVEKSGETLIHPFEDAEVIAGQGTVGLEIMSQAGALGVVPDAVLVPCGGGGLVAGVTTAVKSASSKTEVYCVEPIGFDETRASLENGARSSNTPGARTVCDALQSHLGELTFRINKASLDGGLSVSDEDVYAAMRVAFSDLKMVLEPGGAVALAAILSGRIDATNRTLVAVASGGNVDPDTYSEAILPQ